MRSRTLALAAVAVCAAAAFGWTAVADAAAPGQQLGLARLEAASATPLRVQLDPASGGVSWLRGSFAPLAAAPARDAFLFLDTHRAAFGVTAPRAQFRILGRLHDTVADTNHVVLQQTAAGLPVYGCRLAFHYDRAGRLQTVNGDYLPPATLTVPSTTPSVSAAAAVATATAAAARLAAPSTAGALAPLGRAATARPALARRPVAKLVLYPDLSDTLRLAYVVDVTSASPPSEWHIVVDARRDVVLDRESGLEAAVVKGSGTDLTGRRVGLNLIHPATAVFKMVDQSRYMFRHHSSVHPYSKYRGSIEIRDARHRMSGFQPVMSRSNPTLSNSTRFFGDQGVTNPKNNRRSGVSAARNFSKVYDTLRNCLHRNSVNNKGLSLIGNIHLGVDYENAFWSQGARMMFFGDNAKGQAPFAKSLDVIGHEVGHGVTQYATQSGLDYEDQSGAINESISDIWGATCDYNDWTIGEGLAKKPIRSLRQPSLYGQPEDMLDYTMLPDTSVTDMGGVHIDSGIGNLFFYRLSTDPRTPITPPAKDGRWTAARVVYGSYEYLAGKPRATYADWALALHAAAVTVDAQYSAGGALVAATDQALASVHMSAEIAAYDDGNVFNAQGNLVPPLKFGLGLAGKLAYVGVKVTTPGSMKLATMCIGLLDLGQHATTGDYQVVVLPVAADGGPDMSALSSPLDAELVDVNSAAATRNDGTFMNVKVTGADKVTPEPRSMGGEFFVMIGYVDSPGDATQYGSLMLDDGLGSTGRTWVASQAGSGWVTQSLSGHNALIRAIFTD